MKHMYNPLELFETGEIYCVSFAMFYCHVLVPSSFKRIYGQSESSCIIGSFNHCVCVCVCVCVSECCVDGLSEILMLRVLAQMCSDSSSINISGERQRFTTAANTWLGNVAGRTFQSAQLQKKKKLDCEIWLWRMKACKSLSQ